LDTPALFTATKCLAGLAASDRWDAPRIRAISLKVLSTSRPSTRIYAARNYGKTNWLKAAVLEICSVPFESLTDEDMSIPGPHDILKVMAIRSHYATPSISHLTHSYIQKEFGV
jgi:hypothetical protein